MSTAIKDTMSPGSEFARKLVSVEKALSASRGRFRLFALMLREDSEGKWDLLVSADWVQKNKAKAMKLLATEVKTALAPTEMLSLSRIVIMNVGNPALQAFTRAIRVEHGLAEVKDSSFFGLLIRHAYIITSLR